MGEWVRKGGERGNTSLDSSLSCQVVSSNASLRATVSSFLDFPHVMFSVLVSETAALAQ